MKGTNMLKKVFGGLAVIFIIMAALVGQPYYTWVTSAETPFEEVGIELHRYMPAVIQHWGCARLFERFGGKTLPPYGCQDPNDPVKWRDSG
jgi:hypothetical protein